MAETLDTLGEKIAALTTSVGEMRKQLDGHDQQFVTIGQRIDQVDTRLDQVDTRLDQLDTRLGQLDTRVSEVDARVDQQGSSLRTLIEAVDSKVDLVLEKVSHLITRDIHNSAAHARFETRLDDHELRLIALETGAHGAAPPTDAEDRGGS
jgi:chromosome segregation ATPase